MTTDHAISRYTAEYQEFADQLPGQNLPWLQSYRKEALAAFSESGFPTVREEEWRYTNVSSIEKKRFVPVAATLEPEIEPSLLQSFQLPDVWTIVLCNGRFMPQLSTLNGLPQTVTVMGMAEALAKDPDRVRKRLGQAVTNDEHSFIAFNGAWFSDGLFLQVAAKAVLEKPLQILHLSTGHEGISATRNLLVFEAMAEAQLIETYVGLDQPSMTTAVNEIFIGKNAGFTLYKLQAEGEKAYHFGGTYVKQDSDSRFCHHNFAFGSLMARSDIHCDLGQASECELNGLFLGGKRQHLDNHTRINHLKPYGISREQYKGVLDQRARGVFQGRVVVAENAQKTDSEMNNRNLLLSDDAEADTKPQLEIYADDVKCAHGVTVGQLDEKSIFYLQSRCVDEATARNMLTFAFANEMVNKLKIKSLHDQVLKLLLRRFPQQDVNMDWL